MANDINYEYVDEASIDSELMCSICRAPLNNPLCTPTPCDHTFCHNCIGNWINSNNLSCPTCRYQLSSMNDLVPANRTVRNMLDHLPVKCKFCGQTGLQRGDFNDHTSFVCSKIHVPCPSADIKCLWEGPRDQLNNHVGTCVFQTLRTLLTELLAKNLQFEEKINEQGAQIKQQSTKINVQDVHIKQQGTKINQQDAQLKQQDAKINQQDAQIKQQDAQIKQQDAKIKQQDAIISQQGATILNLPSEIANTLNASLTVQLSNYQKQKCNTCRNCLRIDNSFCNVYRTTGEIIGRCTCSCHNV